MPKANFTSLSLAKKLKSSSFFRNWPAHSLSEVGALFKVVHCAQGEELIQENKRARFLFILLKGKLALSVKKGHSDLIVGIIKKKGELCGWSAIVPPRRYTASVKALEKVEALKIRGKDLEDYLQSHPPLAWRFWQKLASLIAFRLLHTRSLLAETMT